MPCNSLLTSPVVTSTHHYPGVCDDDVDMRVTVGNGRFPATQALGGGVLQGKIRPPDTRRNLNRRSRRGQSRLSNGLRTDSRADRVTCV